MDTPNTLLEAVTYFQNPDNCVNFMVSRRWPDGVVKCPTCNNTHVRFDKKRRIFECNKKHPKRQFSVKVGTIFEDSPLGLDKWLPAVWLITNAKNGISSWEIHRALGVTQKTAWFMLHRIRLAMQGPSGGTLDGEVEVDETYIGGKARNMRPRKKEALGVRRGGSFAGKVPVMGILQRSKADEPSKVRTMVVPNTRKHQLVNRIERFVPDGTKVYTDALMSYRNLGIYYEHGVVDHAERYVDGQIHTNGMENYWSLLKRGLSGTYISVEPFHLFRYLDEQAFRFNERESTDGERFSMVISQIVGRRLMYKDLIGATNDKTLP